MPRSARLVYRSPRVPITPVVAGLLAPGACATRSSRLRSDESTRTSYSVLGARKMHAMRGRPKIAERHGAGHVARCTARAAHGRPGSARCQTPSPRVPRAARRGSSARPTLSKGISARSGRMSCGLPTFPRKREVPPPTCVRYPGGCTSPSSPTCTRGGSSAGRPPAGQCAPTWPWTP